MSLRTKRTKRTKRTALVAGSAAVLFGAGAAGWLVAAPSSHPAAQHQAAAQHPAAQHPAAQHPAAQHPAAQHPSAHLAASTCSGPAGAAYIADAGWDGFSAINTANCNITQTYNVGDTPVPGDSGDYNYSSTDEAVALSGHTLYFADAGNDSVAVIDAATLDPTNYNPPETLIHVGFNPSDLAVTPDGSQLWVADTGPQTSSSSPKAITVISTATDKVTTTLQLSSAPAQVAFSPSGKTAYVTTADGLWSFSTATDRVTGVIRGLGDPHGIAVSPDGGTLYVTNTAQGTVEVINSATNKVTHTITVGQLPWQVVVSPKGNTVYVADPDSDQVSVISTSSETVTNTISISGDPDTLGLTPDGSQLWVGGLTSAIVTVLDTANGTVVGTLNLGDEGANSGDGYEPTGIVLTATPTPSGS
jgi:YVTN family beta-propeller protein